MIRVIVLMTLVPDADVREMIIALAGDLAMVPWARSWVPASERACGDWRNALGPRPLEELQDIVLRASHAGHQDRDWRAVITGRNRPLKAGSLDGTLIRADGSYIVQITGVTVTVTVRVIEYWVTLEGQEVPEMSCLITDLMDITGYPARELAALYRWRRDGSETALREARSCLPGAGPGTGPVLRSGTPGLVARELAAWAAAVEMTRGAARGAALAAVPARKGRRAGQPVQPREISCARARRAILAAIRAGRTSYKALTGAIGKYRIVLDRNRHRARKSRSPGSSGHATLKDTVTRTAKAVITMASNPA